MGKPIELEPAPWSPATCAQRCFALTGALENLEHMATGAFQVNHSPSDSANEFYDQIDERIRPLAEGLYQSLQYWGGVTYVNELLSDPRIDGHHQLLPLNIEQLLTQILNK